MTLSLAEGETLGIIGPNGAGKSTLVNLVSGALKATRGEILLFGDSDRGQAAGSADAARRRPHLPDPASVRANDRAGEPSTLAARNGGGAQGAHDVRARCDAILERTGLSGVAEVEAQALPLLRRKRLELARALALRPRVLLLDEIGAGLVEAESHALIELILEIKREVRSIVLIEHVMPIVTACCDRTAVLNFGRLVVEGPTHEVLRDAATAAVYLGSVDAPATAEPSKVHAEVHGPAEVQAAQPLLQVRGASARYAGVRALRDVDLDIGAGEVVALLGANGAGKTTLARAISGAKRLDAGRIDFAGARIDARAPDAIAAAGLAHCMEGRKIFASLSVEENLWLAAGRATRAERARRAARMFELFRTSPNVVAIPGRGCPAANNRCWRSPAP